MDIIFLKTKREFSKYNKHKRYRQTFNCLD